MTLQAETLRRLAALRLDTDQMAGVLAIIADLSGAEEDRRAKQRDRTRRHRAAQRDGNVTVTGGVTLPPPPKESPPTPPKEITPPSRSLGGDAGALDTDFESWWASYPHKVGKADARKAYLKARKGDGPQRPSASRADLVAGLARYCRDKPPDRPWCNPATWLNQMRWLDDPAPAPAGRPAPASRNQPTGGRHGFDPRGGGARSGDRFDEAAADFRREFGGGRDRAPPDPA